MDVGAAIFLTGDVQHPAQLAQRLEAAGYESLMLTEHTHIPVSAGMVARDGGPLAEYYRRTHDPFVALAFAAAATEKLVIGTSVCLVTEHDPIVLAKVITSLQNLSGGRFVFGIGAGWNKPELLNHGTDPATRHGLMRERVEAMKAIWTQDEAEYHGKHVDFDPIWQWPKPEVPVPVLVGGNGPRVEDRVLRYARRLDAEHEGPRRAARARRGPARTRRVPRARDLLRREARNLGRAVRHRRGPRADRPRDRPRAPDTLN